jgi:ATP-dependent RNA helicase HelY
VRGFTRLRSTSGPGSTRMFDAQTTELIRRAPAIRDVDPSTLPQELTRTYAELIALRLQAGNPAADVQRALGHERLLRTATIYEALVDTGASEDNRRPAAFVAATAYQILGRVSQEEAIAPGELLTTTAIHPEVAAPLLFLIAGQSPDAREAARRLEGRRGPDLIRTALLESVADLAIERFEPILNRAQRLEGLRAAPDGDLITQATQALYGFCWSGVVQLVSELMNRPMPAMAFRRFDTASALFSEVERLAVAEVALPVEGGLLVSSYSGPRHLARLLAQVDRGLQGAGLANLPAPAGANAQVWARWIGHRAKTKPLLWPNHRPSIAQGVLDPGCSAVLVLPTGAGKTTLSELKIAATVAAGRKVIFLVPTLALVDQLRDDLATSFPSDLSGFEVSADGDLTIFASGPELRQIEVMTPERFLALLSFADADVDEVGLIVFDECHLLSPVGGGSRSVDAMLSVLHANKRAPQADFLLLSAMLTNGQEVADWLGYLTSRRALFYHDPWKPSRQARGVVIYPQAELDPIRAYARARRRGLNPARSATNVTAFALFGLQSNWNPAAAQDVRIARLLADQVNLNIGRSGPAPNANAVAVEIAVSAATTNLKTIVFVQQAGHAPSTANRIAERVPGPDHLTDAEEVLQTEIAAELGPTATSLIDWQRGALPHNGDMLQQERRLAESLFRRVNGAKVIIATPTLAQGMNLPAQLSREICATTMMVARC